MESKKGTTNGNLKFVSRHLKLTSYHINGIYARREEESCITNAKSALTRSSTLLRSILFLDHSKTSSIKNYAKVLAITKEIPFSWIRPP